MCIRDRPHIGNTYEIVLDDSIERFKRQQGYDVFLQTGTNEHGQKIELKADEKGITPKEFVEDVYKRQDWRSGQGRGIDWCR